MARNHEKAASMLHRFRASQLAEQGLLPTDGRRPRNPSSVFSLQICEKWRQQVVADLSRKITKIHEYGLSDFEIRDLNDEVNRLIKEKLHWEDQIIRLGGPNYKRFGSKVYDQEGHELPGQRGYRYFGRAKDLPGVKELFDIQMEELTAPKDPKYKRLEKLKQTLGPEYYGDLDEEDGKLLAFEQAKLKQKLGPGWKMPVGLEGRLIVDFPLRPNRSVESHCLYVPERNTDFERLEPLLIEHYVPSQEQVEHYLMEKRK